MTFDPDIGHADSCQHYLGHIRKPK